MVKLSMFVFKFLAMLVVLILPEISATFKQTRSHIMRQDNFLALVQNTIHEYHAAEKVVRKRKAQLTKKPGKVDID